MFQFLSFKKNIDSILFAATGFIIIFLFTRHSGIGVCPDGVVYLTTAENIRSSSNLADYAQNVVVEFPAFYPLFLNAIMFLTSLKTLTFAPVLNSLLFGSVIYLSGNIMEQFSFSSRWYKIAMLSCIVVSPGLLEVYSMLWSETIFILWLLLFMMAMHRYFQYYSRKALIAAAIIASFAAVTRYAGVTIIGTGGILLLLDTQLHWRRKLTDVILYTAISPVLLIMNLARNYKVSGTMTGVRERSLFTLHENLHDAGSVLYDWLPFFNGRYDGSAWITIILIFALSLACVLFLLRRKRLASFEEIATVFALFYLSFMVVTASISRFETLDSRFLSPAFIPLLWAGSYSIVYLSKKRYINKKWVFALGTVLFLCFQYGQLAADYETWDGVKDAGIPGYTEDQWKYSETVLYIQKDSILFQKGYIMYSDANDAIYFFTRRQGKFLPHREDPAAINHFLRDRHCYVIWFNDGFNPDLVGLNFIVKIKKMKLLKQFDDGAIYESDE
ncbi:MAG: hypothetical protein ABI472_07610 [Ginsengibacter sp.]